MTIDPKIAFYIGLVIFVAGIVSNVGTNFFDGALPVAVIGPLVKWSAIIATIGNGVMTYIAGTNMTTAGRLASVQPVSLTDKLDAVAYNNPEVKSIVTTQAIADLTSNDKIVGPPKATGAH